MAKLKHTRKSGGLEPEDREFFSLLVQAIYSNPFSEERAKVLSKLPSDSGKHSVKEEQYLLSKEPFLAERLQRLHLKGMRKVHDFREEDRPLMERAFQLKVYLHFLEDLNNLIREQLKPGPTHIKIAFAEELIGQLKSYGFSEDRCLRYFASFYQLRRAHYFISEALVGDSPSMKKLRLALWNNVFTFDIGNYDRFLLNRMEDFSTLLLGETGTGKGSAAVAIGRSGFIPFDRKKGQFTPHFNDTFVAVNLSQFPETLIESELFGHRKGSFTGALDNHEGWFERCSPHGALFLDEIGDLNVPMQIKLLKVLQERTFSPVGSRSIKRFEGRVIAATNQPVQRLLEQGRFREDFFYRLSSDVIVVPTLRQRISELPSELEQLVDLLIRRLTGVRSLELNQLVMRALKADLPVGYAWPGNVRELEQAVRRILLTRHYTGNIRNAQPDWEKEFLEKIRSGMLPANQLVIQYCTLLYERYGTYEEVARRAQLDRRTVKKYLQESVVPRSLE